MTARDGTPLNFESIRSNFLIGGATLLGFSTRMSAGNAEHGETMDWYVEPNHFGGRRTASSLSRRRRTDGRVNSLAFAVTAALMFVLLASAVMFGGHAAIAPLLPHNGASEADRTGSIVYAMPDGVLCRRMAFDNGTAEVTSIAVEPCPGGIGGGGGPMAGKFEWGR